MKILIVASKWEQKCLAKWKKTKRLVPIEKKMQHTTNYMEERRIKQKIMHVFTCLFCLT